MSPVSLGERPRKPRIKPFSFGFVSVPIDDVLLEHGGYLPGFEIDGTYYCYHALDTRNRGCLLYRDVTEESFS